MSLDPFTPHTASEAPRSFVDDRAIALYSEHMDLRHALTPRAVTELWSVLHAEPATKPWHTWAPLLALGMGLTGPQIAQLDTRQLVARNGRVCIQIPNAKQPERVRSLPLHAALVARDFDRFSHSRYYEQQGDGPLFPDLAGATRPGEAIESWLRRATRRLRQRDGHAPTLRTLRVTAAQAALDGGATMRAAEALLDLPVDLRDDRGPSDAESRQRVLDELLIEAVACIQLPALMSTPPSPPTPVPPPEDELGEPFFYAAEARR